MRTVDADEFFLGVYWTAVGEGELLTHITVPLSRPGDGDALEGITLGANGTYIVNVASSISGGELRIALGCVSAVPERARAVEEALRGRELTGETVGGSGAGPRRDDRSAFGRACERRLPPRADRGLRGAIDARSLRTSEGMAR